MSRRSLWPREHGAYVQLLVPLIAALAASRPAIAGGACAVAACLAFLAHEPLLVVLGTRGARRRDGDGPRARRWLALLAGGALVAGVAGLVVAPPIALAGAGAVGGLAAILVALARKKAEHTLGGELVAAAALTGASAVVRLTGGASIESAAIWWLGWAIGFAATVIAVHRVIARHKRTATALDRVLAVAGVAVSVALVATASFVAAPLVLAATVIVAAPPPATRLRAVGIAVSIVAALSGAIAVSRGDCASAPSPAQELHEGFDRAAPRDLSRP